MTGILQQGPILIPSLPAVTRHQIELDEETHTYRVDGIKKRSVTQILTAAGISDFSNVPPAVLAKAAARGTAVHLATWYDDQDDLVESSVDPEHIGYVNAWRRFKADNNVSILLIEQRIYSERYDFVGTFDRLIWMPRWGLVLPDIKTGTETKAWGPQLAAYLIGFHGSRAPECRRVAVMLRKDGTYSLRWFEQRDLQRDWNIFAGALASVSA